MKATILLCLALAGLPAFAAEPPAESKPLEGVWRPVTATLSAQPVPAALLDTITLKLSGDAYEVTIEGEGTDKGTTKVDTSVTPHRMTITGVEGPNKGKTFLAIYELQEDGTFRICYDLSGKDFPVEFVSIEGTQLYLVTYKLLKK